MKKLLLLVYCCLIPLVFCKYSANYDVSITVNSEVLEPEKILADIFGRVFNDSFDGISNFNSDFNETLAQHDISFKFRYVTDENKVNSSDLINMVRMVNSEFGKKINKTSILGFGLDEINRVIFLKVEDMEVIENEVTDIESGSGDGTDKNNTSETSSMTIITTTSVNSNVTEENNGSGMVEMCLILNFALYVLNF